MRATVLSVGFLVCAAALLVSTAAVAEGAGEVRDRSGIEQKYLWATERIFPSKDAWETEYNAVQSEIGGIAEMKGTLGKSAQSLLAALKATDEIEPRLERIYVYAALLADQDTRNTEHQALRQRAFSLYMQYAQAMAWMTPELTSIPYDQIKKWMQTEPGLALYEHFFDDQFRQKKYVLSDREEELLSLSGEVRSVPRAAYNLLANADIVFPKVKDEDGKMVQPDDSMFYKFMRSNDRRVRREGYEAIVGTYAKYKNTTAALLNGSVQNRIFSKKARGYDSCLQAALNGPNIPVEVYNTLVETVNEGLPLLHRYQDLRKRVLKLDDGVHAYDLFAPLINYKAKEYSYEEAVEVITKALQPMGKGYIEPMTKRVRQSLGGRVSHRGQAQRSLLQRNLPDRAVHSAQLPWWLRRRLHAGPRDGALDALVFLAGHPTLRLCRL